MSNAKNFFSAISKSDIVKIIITTTLFFVIIQSIKTTLLMNDEPTTFYTKKVWEKINIHSSFSLQLKHLWSLLTYQFAEENFMQLVGNMIWLWVFGTVIEDLKGSYQIIPIYIIGGLVAGILFMLSGNIIHAEQIFLYAGTMPSVVAVAVATILYKPKYEFWFLFNRGIPIWAFGVLFFLLQLIAIDLNNFSHISLLIGGILVGVLYNYGGQSFFEKLTSMCKRMANFWSNNENFISQKENVKRNTILQNKSLNTLTMQTNNIDKILDKINEQGIQSLSKKEKELLEKYSKQ